MILIEVKLIVTLVLLLLFIFQSGIKDSEKTVIMRFIALIIFAVVAWLFWSERIMLWRYQF